MPEAVSPSSDYYDIPVVRCPKCGYETRTSSSACPNCYGPLPTPPPAPEPPPAPAVVEPVQAVEPQQIESEPIASQAETPADAVVPTAYDFDAYAGPTEAEVEQPEIPEPIDIAAPSAPEFAPPSASPGPFTGFILGDAPRLEIPEFEPPSAEPSGEDLPAPGPEDTASFELGNLAAPQESVETEESSAFDPVAPTSHQFTQFDLGDYAAVDPQAATSTEAETIEPVEPVAEQFTPVDLGDYAAVRPEDESPAAEFEIPEAVEPTAEQFTPIDLGDYAAVEPEVTEEAPESASAEPGPAFDQGIPIDQMPYADFEPEAAQGEAEPAGLEPVEQIPHDETPIDLAYLTAPETAFSEPTESAESSDFQPAEPTQQQTPVDLTDYAAVEPEPAEELAEPGTYEPADHEFQATPFDFGSLTAEAEPTAEVGEAEAEELTQIAPPAAPFDFGEMAGEEEAPVALDLTVEPQEEIAAEPFDFGQFDELHVEADQSVPLAEQAAAPVENETSFDPSELFGEMPDEAASPDLSLEQEPEELDPAWPDSSDLTEGSFAEAPIEQEPVYGSGTDEDQTPFDFGDFMPPESPDGIDAGPELEAPVFQPIEVHEFGVASERDETGQREEEPATFDLTETDIEATIMGEAPTTGAVETLVPFDFGLSETAEQEPSQVLPEGEALETDEAHEQPAADEFEPFDFSIPAEAVTPVEPEVAETEQVASDPGHFAAPVGSTDEPVPFDIPVVTPISETPAETAAAALEEQVAFAAPIDLERQAIEEPAGEEQAPTDFGVFELDELPQAVPEFEVAQPAESEVVQPSVEEEPDYDFGDYAEAAEPVAEEALEPVEEIAPFDLDEYALDSAAENEPRPEQVLTETESDTPLMEWTPDLAAAANMVGDETMPSRTTTEFVLEDGPDAEVAEFELTQPTGGIPDVSPAVGEFAACGVPEAAAKVAITAKIAAVAAAAGGAVVAGLAIAAGVIGGIGKVVGEKSKRAVGLIARYRLARKTTQTAAPVPAAAPVPEVRVVSDFERGVLSRVASAEQIHVWIDQLAQLNNETDAALADLASAQQADIQELISTVRSAIQEDAQRVEEYKANPFSLYWSLWLKDEREVMAADIGALQDHLGMLPDMEAHIAALSHLRDRYLSPDPEFYNHFGNLVLLYDLYPPHTVVQLAARSGARRCGRALGA